ncbi:MAG: hypothetical protein JSW55_10960 [Chloroflexota bacterium]|nr:MAG: hypothetical protein JSW55_10960 [Chloroflexota bacterium]
MSHKRAGFRWLGLMIALLLGAGLACNAPLAEDEAITVTPPDSPESTEPVEPAATSDEVTLAAPQTVPASLETEEAGEATPEALPTFTPIEPPTLAATLTASATLRPTATTRPGGTPKPTPTPPDIGGPLSFTYEISGRLKDASATQAIATVTIDAKGGSGEYTYFRDDLPVDGPVFEYEWATCSGNPGSLRVDSSDGQTARTEYFENPPCPTSTPTP